jgi:hypothetical protein
MQDAKTIQEWVMTQPLVLAKSAVRYKCWLCPFQISWDAQESLYHCHRECVAVCCFNLQKSNSNIKPPHHSTIPSAADFENRLELIQQQTCCRCKQTCATIECMGCHSYTHLPCMKNSSWLVFYDLQTKQLRFACAISCVGQQLKQHTTFITVFKKL